MLYVPRYFVQEFFGMLATFSMSQIVPLWASYVGYPYIISIKLIGEILAPAAFQPHQTIYGS